MVHRSRAHRSPRAARVAGAALLVFAVAACSPEPRILPLDFPGATGSGQPRLTSDTEGAPVLSWLEPSGEATVLRYARFDGEGFGAAREVVRSERMFINWADFPSVTPVTGELWFAHWLRRQPDSLAYDVATSISRDGGLSWTEAERMNDDESETEHGFVSVFPLNGDAAAVWLDARELANWSFDAPDALLGVSLRFARYAADGRVTERQVVDGLVCDCCQPDVALAAQGPVAVYRDRSEEEIRDVVARRFRDGAWTEPVLLGNESWHIEGCPVNGPVVAARGDAVVAAWFTAAAGTSRVRFARSRDGGASFGAAVDVDSGRALGQPAIVLDKDGSALVSWWRRGLEGGIDLMLRRLDPDDRPGEALTVGHEAIGQAVDVPQLIAAGDDYVVAWTSLADAGTVRIARLIDIP